MRQEFDTAAYPDRASAYMGRQVEALRRQSLLPEFDYIDRIGALYNEQERTLLRSLGERFPRIRLGFTYFGLMTPNMRPFEAMVIMPLQPRTGWLRIGVPDGWAQSVDDHHKSCEKLAKLIFRGDPELGQVCDVLRYHDIGEAVIGDFTPHCPISKNEKLAVEEMAVRLLTTSHAGGNPIAREMHHSFYGYEGLIDISQSVRGKAKDIDLLEMPFEIPMIRFKCPPDERAAMEKGLSEFEEYVAPLLQRQRAKSFFEGLIQTPDRYASPIIVWQNALTHMEKHAAPAGP